MEESPLDAVVPQSFGRLRDSITIRRENQVTHSGAAKEEVKPKELQRRSLEKKYESSPNLVRKKEAISQVINHSIQ